MFSLPKLMKLPASSATGGAGLRFECCAVGREVEAGPSPPPLKAWGRRATRPFGLSEAGGCLPEDTGSLESLLCPEMTPQPTWWVADVPS